MFLEALKIFKLIGVQVGNAAGGTDPTPHVRYRISVIRQGRDLNPKALAGTGCLVCITDQLLMFSKLKTGAIPDSATLA